MAATGWTWAELNETPMEIVAKMTIYLAVKNVKEFGGELNFPGED